MTAIRAALLHLALLMGWVSMASAQASAPPAVTESAEEAPPLLREPALVEFVQAPYPEEARAAGVEGEVLLLLELDATGVVTHAEILEPVGYGLDEAALDAAWKLRFSPAEDETGPVPVAIEFRYGFVLDAASRPEAVPEGAQEAPLLPINLDGLLLEMGTQRPLAGVPIRVEAAGQPPMEATTDAEGRFAFRGVPPGTVAVSASYPGYDRAERTLEITAGEATTVRLWIRNQSYRDDELVGVYQRVREDVTRRTLSVEEVRRIPGTFGDPVRVVQNLPGAARTPFGTGVLVIRGANPEDSAVYIDGIRVPLIYHLGGYESVINGDIVEAVDYLPGGYGVGYGRSLGGVVDVRTKDTFPEQTRVVWSTDALDSGGLVEGRLGKGGTGFAVAARRSYIDALIPLFLRDSELTIRPAWWDYQLKVADRTNCGGAMSAFVFGFRDTLFASSGAANQGTDPDTQGDLGTAYGTHRLLLHWDQPMGEAFQLSVSPSVGVDTVALDLGNDFHLDQDVLLLQLRAALAWKPTPRAEVSAGVDFLGGFYWFNVKTPFDPSLLAEYDPLAEREPFTLSGDGTAWGPDTFVEGKLRPLADPEALLLAPGLRINNTQVLGQFGIISVDPRLLGRWSPYDGGALKGGLGLYHQPPQPFEAWRPDGAVKLTDERVISAELGFEQQFTEALNLDVTGFYKHLDALIVPNPELDDLQDEYFLNEGTGRIYGGELLLRHARVDRFFGWLSYTLSRSERNDYPERAGDEDNVWYLYELDQTHILVGVAGYRLPRDFEVSGKVQFVSGNPYTPYDGGVYDIDQDLYFSYATGDRNSERLPPFLAMDFRVDKLFTFKRWQLEVYLDLLNAVRGVNPEFVVYNYDYTESRYIRGLPFIPSPGFQAEFRF